MAAVGLVHEESVSTDGNSIPSLPPDSPGSSVSSRMQVTLEQVVWLHIGIIMRYCT